MKTTIYIDDELFEIVRSTAHQNKKGIDATMQTLILRGLRREVKSSSNTTSEVDELTGFPILQSKSPVTAEDIRSLEDDE
mgnify:CR=1 FL=1